MEANFGQHGCSVQGAKIKRHGIVVDSHLQRGDGCQQRLRGIEEQGRG